MDKTARVVAIALLSCLTGCDQESSGNSASTADRARASTPAIEQQTTTAAAPIPDQPLAGTINGIALSGFKGWYERDILWLYTGADKSFEFDTRLTLFFVIEQSVAERDIDIDQLQQTNQATVHLHLESKEHDAIRAAKWLLICLQKTRVALGRSTGFCQPTRSTIHAAARLTIASYRRSRAENSACIAIAIKAIA